MVAVSNHFIVVFLITLSGSLLNHIFVFVFSSGITILILLLSLTCVQQSRLFTHVETNL